MLLSCPSYRGTPLLISSCFFFFVFARIYGWFKLPASPLVLSSLLVLSSNTSTNGIIERTKGRVEKKGQAGRWEDSNPSLRSAFVKISGIHHNERRVSPNNSTKKDDMSGFEAQFFFVRQGYRRSIIGSSITCFQGCVRYGTGIIGNGMDVVPKLRKCPVPVLMSYRTCRSIRYRYWCRTEIAEVSGTGIRVVPNLPKCPVPAFVSYRTCRSVGYRY